MRTSPLLLALLLAACGDETGSDAADTSTVDTGNGDDSGTGDVADDTTDTSTGTDTSLDVADTAPDEELGGTDTVESDTTVADVAEDVSGTPAANECAGLDVLLRSVEVTDACAEDASSGGVLPDLGEVSCRDDVSVDVEAAGAVTYTVADGSFANPTGGRGDVAWRAWVPERGPEEGVAPSLVVMLHGFGANLSSLTFQSERLASYGFAVIAITFPNAGFGDPPAQDLKVLEVKATIDLALDAAGPFAGNVNAEQIAIAGHSLGGKIGFFTAASDPRVDIVIGMDPNNGGGPPCFIGDGCNDYPVAPNCVSGDVGVVGDIQAEALVFATEDATLTPDAHLRAVHFYRGAPSPSHILHFEDAGHADWISSNATRDFSMAVTTALLLRRFYGVSAVESWLPGGAEVEAQVGDLLDYAESR